MIDVDFINGRHAQNELPRYTVRYDSFEIIKSY